MLGCAGQTLPTICTCLCTQFTERLLQGARVPQRGDSGSRILPVPSAGTGAIVLGGVCWTDATNQYRILMHTMHCTSSARRPSPTARRSWVAAPADLARPPGGRSPCWRVLDTRYQPISHTYAHNALHILRNAPKSHSAEILGCASCTSDPSHTTPWSFRRAAGCTHTNNKAPPSS